MPSDRSLFGKRTFAPEEVAVLVRELQALRDEEQDRIPYARVQDMLAELSVEPARLDEAIARLDLLQSTPSPPAWQRWVWGVVAALLVAVCSFALLGRTRPASPPANVAAATAVPMRPRPQESQERPPAASPAQLGELQEQSLLFVTPDSYRLVVHNPLSREVKRLLVRIDTRTQGRRFEQNFWFTSFTPLSPDESVDALARHELPEPPQIHSWKIVAAEF